MPWDNCLNPGKGRDFQIIAAKALSRFLGVQFQHDQPIPIGRPPKAHRFGLVSVDQKYVGECKSYSWTETGNMPSAKMGFVNEAVLYLSYLPADMHKFIVMRLDRHSKRVETLAQYYLRTYRHLLGGLHLYEIDPSSGAVEEHLIDK
jgi:hypothetical protein